MILYYDQTIRIHQDEAYKYLGILQLDNIKDGQVKNMISKKYIQRVIANVLKMKLNNGNTIKIISTWAKAVIQ